MKVRTYFYRREVRVDTATARQLNQDGGLKAFIVGESSVDSDWSASWEGCVYRHMTVEQLLRMSRNERRAL